MPFKNILTRKDISFVQLSHLIVRNSEMKLQHLQKWYCGLRFLVANDYSIYKGIRAELSCQVEDLCVIRAAQFLSCTEVVTRMDTPNSCFTLVIIRQHNTPCKEHVFRKA